MPVHKAVNNAITIWVSESIKREKSEETMSCRHIFTDYTKEKESASGKNRFNSIRSPAMKLK